MRCSYNSNTTTTTTTRHCTTLHYTSYITLHYITLHYNCKCNCNYTTLITLRYNYNSTTLQLQLHYTTTTTTTTTALRHTTSSSCGEVTIATIATTPKNTTPTTWSPFDPSVNSLCHPWFTTTNLSYMFPIFETSATALCGTTGSNSRKLDSNTKHPNIY